jgi:transcription elongation factor GreA
VSGSGRAAKCATQRMVLMWNRSRDHELVPHHCNGFQVMSSKMDRIPMTAEGYATLEAELKHCREIERPCIIQQIADARGAEDPSDNVEYHVATELQSVNEARIVELEDKLARAEIIDISKLSGETITFGATVTLLDENTDKKSVWQIVGEPERRGKSRSPRHSPRR